MPKGDRPHMRYLLDRGTHIKYRRLMKTLNSTLKFAASDPAKFRLHVIKFSQKYGVVAALEAFEVKRSTFFYWKQQYQRSGNKLVSLVPSSTRPKNLRKMETDLRLVEFIKQTRKEYGNVGTRIIKPFLDEYAASQGLPSLGRTTIEKVIRVRKLTFEVRTRSKRRTKYTKLRTRKSPKVQAPGYIEVDTIHVSLFGKRHYFVSVIDIFTRYAQVSHVPGPSSQNTTRALTTFMDVYHYRLHTIQTDNGSEFLGEFHHFPQRHQLNQVFIYPNSPKLNGVVERFNRTVQEEFINRSEDLGVNQTSFNQKLTKYLYWYNYQRPHSSLGYVSPMQFINAQSPKSV